MAKIEYSPFMQGWVEMLKQVSTPSNFTNGRYAANDSTRIRQVRVQPGHIQAQISNTHFSYEYAYSDEGHTAHLRVPTIDDLVWQRVGARLAADREALTRLLGGDLLTAMQLCHEAGAELIPTWEQIQHECSYDAGLVCRHVIAVGYKLGMISELDAFVMLALRGGTRERLLVPLGLAEPEPPPAPIPTDLGLFWRLDQPYPDLPTALQPFDEANPPLAALGNPPGWQVGSLSDTLRPVYVDTSRFALELLDIKSYF